MWSNYSAACRMYNVITKSVPEDTFVNLTENFLNSERNHFLNNYFNNIGRKLKELQSTLK
jgi:hypothetical protein